VKIIWTATAALALATANFSAPAPATAQQAAQRAQIPFSPPVGQKLSYRLARVDKEAGGEKRSEGQVDVSFRRARDGYAMEVVYVLGSGAAGFAGDPALSLLTKPLSFRVNDGGEIVGIDNETAYWASFELLMAKMEQGSKDAAAVRSAVDMLRGLPAQSRLALLSRGVAPLLALSASELGVGETLEAEEEGQTPMGPVPQQVRLTLDRVSEGRAHVTSVSTIPAAQLEAAMRRFVAETKAAPFEEKLVSIEHRESYEVDLATGLAERYVSTKTVETESAGKRAAGVRTETIERIR
jgi:hypothetical protein